MEVPIWLDYWEHACCGPYREVGQQIDFHVVLDLRGHVGPGKGPQLIEVGHDGEVLLVGTNRGTRTDGGVWDTITLVEARALRLGVEGSHAPDIIECRGKLWEARHQGGLDGCHGLVRSIKWYSAILEVTELSAGSKLFTVVGYNDGVEIASTDDIPEDDSGAFEFIVELADLAPNDGV